MSDKKSRDAGKISASGKISESLRNSVWIRYRGAENGVSVCYCCSLQSIDRGNYECGHVLSRKFGGPSTLQNLRPICRKCNASMGAKHMKEFMMECGYTLSHWEDVEIYTPRAIEFKPQNLLQNDVKIEELEDDFIKMEIDTMPKKRSQSDAFKNNISFDHFDQNKPKRSVSDSLPIKKISTTEVKDKKFCVALTKSNKPCPYLAKDNTLWCRIHNKNLKKKDSTIPLDMVEEHLFGTSEKDVPFVPLIPTPAPTTYVVPNTNFLKEFFEFMKYDGVSTAPTLEKFESSDTDFLRRKFESPDTDFLRRKFDLSLLKIFILRCIVWSYSFDIVFNNKFNLLVDETRFFVKEEKGHTTPVEKLYAYIERVKNKFKVFNESEMEILIGCFKFLTDENMIYTDKMHYMGKCILLSKKFIKLKYNNGILNNKEFIDRFNTIMTEAKIAKLLELYEPHDKTMDLFWLCGEKHEILDAVWKLFETLFATKI